MLKKRWHSKLLLVLTAVVVLPACYKKVAKQSANKGYYEEQPVLLSQAHLADIPLPIQAHVRPLSGSSASVTGLTFTSTFLLADLVKFYQLEMERLGWKELNLFGVNSEVLLVFEKPDKFCTVSVRPDNRVVIFFGTRT